MQTIHESNNSAAHSPQTEEENNTTIDNQEIGATSVCMTSKKQIISQALIAAAKEPSSGDSIVESSETSKNGSDDKQQKADVIDRFFGFAESLICSADSTTNVDMDPMILIAQERTGLFVCGGEEKIVDDKVHTKTLVEKSGDDQLNDESPQAAAEEPEQAGNDGTKLQKKASDDTGSTVADSVVGIRVTENKQPKSWASLYCCMGRDIEDSVVFTESIQASA